MEQINALFDTGATRSFISTSLAQRLKLPSLGETICLVSTFGGKQERKRSQQVSADAIGITGKLLPMKFLTTNTLTDKITIPRLSKMDINYILRNNVDAHLLNTSDVKIFPEVLIGIDHYNDVINTSEPSITLPSGLLAVPTFFGHVITGMGNADASSKNWLTSNAFLSLAQPEHENFDLSAMWALENFGITDPHIGVGRKSGNSTEFLRHYRNKG
ncbi:hypothetical protein OSTOST_04012 [Ostertagia ostertagi]